MVDIWPVKAPSEIVERTWEVPTGDEDSLASFATSISGVTLDKSENDGDLITLTLSAGTTGATGTVEITATTTNSLVITAKFYQPVRADGFQFAYTAREICNHALRKVSGIHATADGAELDDALERMGDMLGAWSGEGADLAVKTPIDEADILYVPDWAIEPIKANLTCDLHDFYGLPITAKDAMKASKGLQRIKAKLLPDEREGVDYY